MKEPSNMSPKYSGPGSAKFWRRIEAIKGARKDVLYSMGCVLQNLEHLFLYAECGMLNELEKAEKKKKPARKVK